MLTLRIIANILVFSVFFTFSDGMLADSSPREAPDYGGDQSAGAGEDYTLYNSPGMGMGGGGGWSGGRGGMGRGGSSWNLGFWGRARSWLPWNWGGSPVTPPPTVPPPEDPDKFIGGGGNANTDDLLRRIKKLERLLENKKVPRQDTGGGQDN